MAFARLFRAGPPSCARQGLLATEVRAHFLGRPLPFRTRSALPSHTDPDAPSALAVGPGAGGGLEIVRPDAAVSAYHPRWLWSVRPESVHSTSGQRLADAAGGRYAGQTVVRASHSGPSDAATAPPPPPWDSCHPIGVYATPPGLPDGGDEGTVCVVWSDGAESEYDAAWLRRFDHGAGARGGRRARNEVPAGPRVGREGAPASFDYDASVGGHGTAAALLDMYRAIFTDGAALLTGVPPPRPGFHPVRVAADALSPGGTSHAALYGDLFEVRSRPSAHNVAYTDLPLAPHQDLAYYASPPGLQLLHCVTFGDRVEGGESTLVDGMAAAAALRTSDPDRFRTLSEARATFIKQREGASMTYLRPHIDVLSGPAGDGEREIVGVHWAPPFEGPLTLPRAEMDRYYDAYGAFEMMVDDSLPPDASSSAYSEEQIRRYREFARRYTWEKRLEEGEMLVFNNQRMLHGRRGFRVRGGDGDGGGVERLFEGCYTDICDTLGRYRVLQRTELSEREAAGSMKNVGNGTTIFP